MAVWVYAPSQGGTPPGTWVQVGGFGVTDATGIRAVQVFDGTSWSVQASFSAPASSAPSAVAVTDAQQTGSAVARVTVGTLPTTPNHERWQVQWRVGGTVDAALSTGTSGAVVSRTVPNGSFVEAQVRHVNDLGTGPWSAWGAGSTIQAL